MTIKFMCSCGKRLRARDEMARRRSICPRCGKPVGIPSLQPLHPDAAAAPLTPAERLRLAAQRKAAPIAETAIAPPPRSAAPPVAAAIPRDRLGTVILALLLGRRTRTPPADRPLETHWYQCLLYPFHDWRLWVGPAVLLALAISPGLLLLPRLLADAPADSRVREIIEVCAGVAVLFVVGYPCNFLGGVLRSAAQGDGWAAHWPGHSVAGALRSSLIWMACFLAGPVIFAAVAAAYWLQCGDLGPIDWLILAELSVLTVGSALLVLAAVSEHGRLRDANPIHVIDLAHRLGLRAAAAALVGAVLAVAHGALVVIAAVELHREVPIGLGLLIVCCLSGMFWATFLFRLLGMWCYRSRGLIRG
jgi:hypothetical protein